MLRMAAVPLQVLMLVGRFAVQVCSDTAPLQVHCGVKEGDRARGPLCSELDGLVMVVEVVEEGSELGFAMGPQ